MLKRKAQKNHIIRVLFPFIGATLGGSHISTLTLARGLEELGVRCTFALKEDSRYADLLRQNGFEPIKLPDIPIYGLGRGLSYRIRRSNSVLRHRSWIKAREFDLVHSNDLKMNLLWSSVCDRTNLKHIWHQRTCAPIGEKKSSIFLPQITKSDMAIFVSRYAELSVDRRAQCFREVIYNPIGRAFSVEESESTLTPNRSNFPITIGMLSNYNIQKRLELFIEFASRFRVENALYRMAGAYPSQLHSKLESLAKELQVEDVIRIDGAISDVRSWLKKIDVLICPARGEAFGRTLIEGMASGCVVVASREGGHREIIEDGVNGFFFEPDNIQDLMSRVRMAIEARTAGWPVERIKRDTIERYSEARHAEEVLNVYRRVLE